MSTCADLFTACHVLTGQRHSWLFPQLDAVLHHGGAGTTGASLRGTALCLPMSFSPMAMMTHPDSWHPYSDPSVVRVSSSAFKVFRNCTDVPDSAETSSFGHRASKSSGWVFPYFVLPRYIL
jgi:hypothetical protein